MIGDPGRTRDGSAEAPNGTALPDRPDPARADPAQMLRRASGHLRGLVEDVKILGNVRADRLELRLRRKLGDAQRALVWGVATAALAVAGVVVLSIGSLRAFDALFEGRPGLGGIAAGLALIAAAAVVSIARSASAHRALVRRLEEKYASTEEPAHAPKS